MAYEWDDTKSEQNRKQRGFGFEIVEAFDFDLAIGPEVQYVEEEEREFWVGPIDSRLYAIVLTERGENSRIVSLRRASNTEIRRWKREYHNG